MEPLPVPAGPSNDEVHLLRGPSNFLEGGYNTDTTYSSVISVRDICFTVELKRRDSATVVSDANPNSQKLSHAFSRAFNSHSSILQVIRTLVACPSWTHGRLYAAIRV